MAASWLTPGGAGAGPGAMYLERFQMVMAWPYGDQCRLTARQAGELPAALTRPLTPFGSGLLPARSGGS